MTKDEAARLFKQSLSPTAFRSSSGRIDQCALNEAWGVYIDRLHKDGLITQKQYETWEGPRVRRVSLRPSEIAEVVEGNP